MSTVFVGVNACISIFFSWGPNDKMLGTYDQIVSIIAGIIAIVVGIMTIINYIKKWKAE